MLPLEPNSLNNHKFCPWPTFPFFYWLRVFHWCGRNHWALRVIKCTSRIELKMAPINLLWNEWLQFYATSAVSQPYCGDLWNEPAVQCVWCVYISLFIFSQATEHIKQMCSFKSRGSVQESGKFLSTSRFLWIQCTYIFICNFFFDIYQRYMYSGIVWCIRKTY